jgi:hypothetical protein
VGTIDNLLRRLVNALAGDRNEGIFAPVQHHAPRQQVRRGYRCQYGKGADDGRKSSALAAVFLTVKQVLAAMAVCGRQGCLFLSALSVAGGSVR